MTGDKQTTDLSRRTLPELEHVIEKGLRTFVDVGLALVEIRNRRLFQVAGYSTFEAYCRERWGFQASRARQLIGAAETVTTVTATGLPAPDNERQARALARLRDDPEAMTTAWSHARESAEEHGRPVTTADVEQAVRDLEPDRDPVVSPNIWTTDPDLEEAWLTYKDFANGDSDLEVIAKALWNLRIDSVTLAIMVKQLGKRGVEAFPLQLWSAAWEVAEHLNELIELLRKSREEEKAS